MRFVDRVFPSLRISQFPGFTYLGENEYSCGGITNRVKEYRHIQTQIEFNLVPGGSFMMGSDEAYSDERPVHTVTLSPFLIGKYQVTQAVWQKIMGNNPSNFKGENHPVEQVSWYDCQKFCNKIGLKLPTEAQWEYACQAGSTGKYCFGDDESLMKDYAWYGGSWGDEHHPVGQKQPNAFGLYDMHGNVWEWCQDWWDENYYANSPEQDPGGPQIGSSRVFRGGSFYDPAGRCRCAYRAGNSPGSRDRDLGFRVAASS